jgi:hypothetical protein
MAKPLRRRKKAPSPMRLDAGADTIARFHFQAELSAPLCFRCAVDPEIVAVLPEYLEDVALECTWGWRFIQIKSRDPELGIWRLSLLLGESGALRSLYRTFVQTMEKSVRLELILEGAIKRNDPIANLLSGGDRTDSTLVSKVATALEITEDEARKFLSKVYLHERPVAREGIEASNLRVLHQQAPRRGHDEVLPVYNKMIDEILRAMRAAPIGELWPSYVVDPVSAPTQEQQRIQNKRITKEQIKGILSDVLGPPGVLLRRLTDSESTPASVLEEKLRVGGAPEDIITHARVLRFEAERRIVEMSAGSATSVELEVEDLRTRLEVFAVAERTVNAQKSNPAPEIWNGLVKTLGIAAAGLDPAHVLRRDPMLLLGEICELAQRCRFNFGYSQ